MSLSLSLRMFVHTHAHKFIGVCPSDSQHCGNSICKTVSGWTSTAAEQETPRCRSTRPTLSVPWALCTWGTRGGLRVPRTHTAQPGKANTALETSYLDGRQGMHYLIAQLAEPPLKHLAGWEYLQGTAHWANTAGAPTRSAYHDPPRARASTPASPCARWSLPRATSAQSCRSGGQCSQWRAQLQHSPGPPIWQTKCDEPSPQRGSYFSFPGAWAWVMGWRPEFCL